MIEIMDFGRQPLGNGFLKADDFADEYFFQMKVGFSEESKMFQLLAQPEPKKMFHKYYAFYSSTSNYMACHFRKLAEQVISLKCLSGSNPFVVELGCNDGIMLQHFAKKNIRHLGIEPSLNVAKEANRKGVKTLSEFFDENLAAKIVCEHGQADAFLAANVMCHIPNITSVVKGIRCLLKPKGIVVFEDPYLGDVVEKTSYDQIYDEHMFLFSALSIRHLFEMYGMELVDLQPQKTHGGSMRYVLAHKGAHQITESVNAILAREKEQGLDNPQTFKKFRKKVEHSREQLVYLLTDLKRRGKKIAGYAATSKSTTILNYCGIGPDLIEYITDTTPIKQGKFSPGMHIPIVPYEQFQQKPPDYAFLFAWNHFEEILAKESRYVASGGKWISHVPEVRVIG